NQMQIDFGGYLYFTRGLGVSMNVTAAGEDARFIVSDVAAYFKD
ncbi:MAG: tungsten ABC transporter permease, partial [Deltaproteobacteria bacterium]|nr:tungsten ABC transporter permease [Deltaproteobacteria bacterium]